MIKVAWVRGAYLNNFEGQNYVFNKDSIELVGFSSLRPIHTDLPFPIVRLPSLSDFSASHTRAVKIIANRTFGDMQILFGLGNFADKFDIFHTADPHYYYSYQLARLRKKGNIKRLLVTSWETIPHNNESAGKKRKIKQFVMEYADHFLCYTEKAKRCLVLEGVREDRITVIKLGVDADKFKYLPSENTRKSVRLLFAGRLVEEKGVMDLYEAFKLAHSLNPTLQDCSLSLQIIGEGPLKSRIEKKVKKDGFGKIITIGTRTYGEMPDTYRQADIFVLPSKHTKTWEEQYGMVLVEAMASGLPVVSYDTGAVREVVGDAGILVKEGNVKGLAFAIHKLCDSTQRIRIGTIGRERVQKDLNSSSAAEKIAGLYRKLYKQKTVWE